MRSLHVCCLVIPTFFLLGCGGSGDDSIASVADAPGTLTLALVDAPVEDVAEVWIEFDAVSVNDSDGNTTTFDLDPAVSVDLLTLVDGASQTLVDEESLPAGVYSNIRLAVNAEFDGVFDSYVIDDTGAQIELRVPSGSQSGLKVIDGVTITSNTGASFILDWDVRKGLVDPRGQPGYFLKPTIRVIDENTFGTVSGTVAEARVQDASCTNDLATDEGNAVYIFAGLDTTPTDIAGLETDPVATVAVRQANDGSYAYSAVLTPGDYTLAFTCQASSDDPEVDQSTVIPDGEQAPLPLEFVTTGDSSVSVEEGGSYTVDF